MPGNSIITIAGPEQLTDRTSRRFLAGLCLLEFYLDSVQYGSELIRGAIWPQEYREDMFWVHVFRVLRALVFLGLGRSLWQGRGLMICWGVGAVVSTIALAALWYHLVAGSVVGRALLILSSYQAFWQFVPLLIALAAGGWCWIRGRQGHTFTRGWTLVAAGWCFAQAPLVFLPGSLAEQYSEGLTWPGKTSALYLCRGVYLLALLCTGAGLLLEKKIARMFVLALGASMAVPEVLHAYILPMLVNAAIEALMISNPYNPKNPVPWPWILLNEWTFIDIFVGLPKVLLPWLLIAWYARHVPMRGMPDDGTPYPRLYCSQCGYNLRGLTGGNCPECGAAVDLPLVATSTPSAAS